MSDILEEAKIDYSEERKLKYFKKAIPLVIGFTILVVLGMVWNNYSASKRKAHNQETGDALIKAIEIGATDMKVSDEALKALFDKSTDGASDLAAFEKVGRLIETKDIDGAMILLDAVAKDGRVFASRNYAMLEWMSLAIDKQDLSDADRAIMVARIEHFDFEDEIFFGSAQIIAALYESKNQKLDSAKARLKRVTDSEKVPPFVREHAVAVLGNLNI